MKKFLCLILPACAALMANPQLDQVTHGEANISSINEKSMQVQTSDRAVIHWKDFSIGQDELTQFIQPSSDSAVLNRVVEPNVSEILGKLQANGKIYLINPNGVLVGANAVIETNGFIASSLDVLDESFLKDRELDFKGESEQAVINLGLISAGENDIYLIARKVVNEGILQAKQGGVYLASGHEVVIKEKDFLIRPNLSSDETASCVENKGIIQAVKVHLLSEGSPYSLAINHSGRIDALEFSQEEQKIVLCAEKGGVQIGGAICANQADVDLSGEKIHMQKNSSIQNDKGKISFNFKKAAVLDGTVQTKEGNIQITSDRGILYRKGVLDVSGEKAGSVSINVHKAIGAGKIDARGEIEGGKISILGDQFVETAQSECLVEGEKSGSIEVKARDRLFSSGFYSATASSSKGGEIRFLGKDIVLSSAHVDASGDQGGGIVTIGGDFQGKDEEIVDTQTVYLTPFTKITADSLRKGDGGKITIWSDKKTDCFAQASCKGGNFFGKGGFVEISSKGDVLFQGDIFAGTGAKVLFDPKNIVVSSNGTFPFVDLIDPNAGTSFGYGTHVVVLNNNGNVVITKPQDNFAAENAGAVYLYNGQTGSLISTITGSQENDQIGSGNVTALTNGNFVFNSPAWSDGATTDVGAVTFANGVSGISGVVSETNSLIGSTTYDNVGGYNGVTALTNGNYVVVSTAWNDGIPYSSRGAVTFGDGTTGISGVVSSTNSLVGSTDYDMIGFEGVVPLTNGNYVVVSSMWNDGGFFSNKGAVTFGNGTTGVTGPINASNSIVGTNDYDQVGSLGVVALSNGNYVAISPAWDSFKGAVTFGDGTTGVVGALSELNSLVGATLYSDSVGSGGVIALTNGNYVVSSPAWDNLGVSNAGAVTLCNGTTGTVGTVSTANSLHGSSSYDQVGLGLVALTNGNYVVASPFWDNGSTRDVGAVTFGDGTTGVIGAVSASNSLTGSIQNDRVGGDVFNKIYLTALTNGNYVVGSPNWNNGEALAGGAVTFADGTTGISGAVSSSNSLVGPTTSDLIGNGGIFALTNGNYVVCSPNWNNDIGVADVGAVTFCDGVNGTVGDVTATNSLVGSTVEDKIGSDGITPLTNGNYVVRSVFWDNSGVSNVGAVTFGSGTTGISGLVNASNSLVGSTINDFVGNVGITALSNGNYLVKSSVWDDGSVVNAGAVTHGDGLVGISGEINSSNSILGANANSGLNVVSVNSVHNNYFVSFTSYNIEGRVTMSSANPQDMTYSQMPESGVSISPEFLTNMLNQGADVKMQANNDITINDAITTSASGSGGDLSFSAGRSLAVNANIETDGGNLTLIANDTAASGVIDSQREEGIATLAISENLTLSANGGNVEISLKDGEGNTFNESGSLSIGANTNIQTTGSGIVNISAQQQVQTPQAPSFLKKIAPYLPFRK